MKCEAKQSDGKEKNRMENAMELNNAETLRERIEEFRHGSAWLFHEWQKFKNKRRKRL